MAKFTYAPSFLRQLGRLDKDLQEEVLEKIELFKGISRHKGLKIHKLHGSLKGCYGFSVNYRIRVVFGWKGKDEVFFFAVGDHDVYKKE